jgi:hypothetical protein
VFENEVFRNIYGSNRDEVTRDFVMCTGHLVSLGY